MRFWFKRVFVHYGSDLPKDAPIIFASTHPNSAIDYLFSPLVHNQPTYVLVRGDVFEKPALNKIFRAIFMLPVYRFRDGFASLNKNEQSFKECYNTFDKNGNVLIFSEGVCIQEKVLQPLRKGTARLALDYLHKHGGKKIYVVSQAISYTQFRKFRASAMVNFGTAIDATQYNDLYAQNPNKAYEALTADITISLEKDFIIEKNYNDDSLTEKALMALRLTFKNSGTNWIQHDRSRFELENKLVEKLNAVGDDALSAEWKQKATDLNLNPKNEGLLSEDYSKIGLIIKMITLAPFVFMSNLTVFLPKILTRWIIKNKIKDIIFHNTITVIGSVLIYLIQSLILLLVGLGVAGIYGIALPMMSIILTMIGIEVMDEYRLAKYNWRNIDHKSGFEYLHQEVRKLIEID